MLKIPKYPNLTELTYFHIKQHILDGSLEEGARLTEETLAAQLGISKSPVREALNRLESDGLISIESRRGAYVRKFSHKEARDLYELRELLEVHAVGLAKITPSFLAELAESIVRIKRNLDEGNRMAYVEEDIRFHNLIAAAIWKTSTRKASCAGRKHIASPPPLRGIATTKFIKRCKNATVNSPGKPCAITFSSFAMPCFILSRLSNQAPPRPKKQINSCRPRCSQCGTRLNEAEFRC
jgi:DNA-binding transcriptional regulator YhcF (GntR family)